MKVDKTVIIESTDAKSAIIATLRQHYQPAAADEFINALRMQNSIGIMGYCFMEDTNERRKVMTTYYFFVSIPYDGFFRIECCSDSVILRKA